MRLLKHEGVQSSVEGVCAEEELEEFGREFQTLFNLMPDPVVIVDGKGKFLAVNDKVKEKTGFNKKELLGKNFLRIGIVTAKSKAILIKNLAKRMMGINIEPYEIEVLSKDGQKILAEINARKIEYGGKPADLVIFRDITERKKMEESLLESEERYRELTESISDVFFAMDKDLRYTYWNKASEKLTGISAKDSVGRSLTEIFPDVEGTRIEQIYLEVLRTKQHQNFVNEYRLGDKDFVFEIDAYPTKDGLSVFVKDITERKQAEEALRESEEKFRNLAEQSPNMIFINKKGRVVYANKKCEEIMGYTREEFYSPDFSFLTLISPESVDLVKSNFSRHMKGEEVAPYEYRLITKEGKKIEAIMTPKLIRYEEESAILGIVTDITERKKMERKLQEYAEHLEEMVEEKTKELRESQDRLKKSEEMYRLLVENSNDGISIVDFEGKILFANRKLKEMYGYEEMEGMSIVENIHPDVRKEVVEDIQKATMTGEIDQNIVVKVRSKDGTPFWVETNAVFVKENGKPVGFLSVSRDITERKRMEERLLKSERLAAIGEVATMVGHDLRNPLQSIENATYCLNNELPNLPVPQKVLEMLQVINDSVNYADKIIRDLHDFSATKKPILKKININSIVKETLIQVEASENVKLIAELGNLPRIEVDKDMIKRVFLNLTMNGIQAIKERGGTLKISTKKTKGFIEVSFRDTGIGIPKEKMKKLFTPFFTTKAKGLGMGLAICKRLVDAHGGSVEVESKKSKGSTFTVKLPIQ